MISEPLTGTMPLTFFTLSFPFGRAFIPYNEKIAGLF